MLILACIGRYESPLHGGFKAALGQLAAAIERQADALGAIADALETLVESRALSEDFQNRIAIALKDGQVPGSMVHAPVDSVCPSLEGILTLNWADAIPIYTIGYSFSYLNYSIYIIRMKFLFIDLLILTAHSPALFCVSIVGGGASGTDVKYPPPQPQPTLIPTAKSTPKLPLPCP